MCNKQQHQHRIQAEGQALSLMKSKRFKGGRLKIYKCKCGCFHITRK